MKNVTITLDERTASWIRVHAAKHKKSVSRIVGEMLHDRMQELHDYDDAMRRFLAKRPSKLNAEGRDYPRREDLHDRPRLR
jgi:hypothetical protein